MQIRLDYAKIKRWREERGWSQEHLAELAGIGVRTVQRIESGDAASQESVMALAAAFDVDILAMTKDVEAEAEQLVRQKNKKMKDDLRLSLGVHLASYLFSMIVFALIGLGDGSSGYAMLWPSIGWTMVIAAHALVVAIHEMVAYYDVKRATAD